VLSLSLCPHTFLSLSDATALSVCLAAAHVPGRGLVGYATVPANWSPRLARGLHPRILQNAPSTRRSGHAAGGRSAWGDTSAAWRSVLASVPHEPQVQPISIDLLARMWMDGGR
jgi:hypothetical protein